MSTTLAPATPTTSIPPRDGRSTPALRHAGGALSGIGVLRSEWTKLLSVRSTTWTLVAAAGAMLFFGAIATAVAGGLIASPDDGGGGPGGGDPTGTALAGALLAPLITGVLGVMVITSEYATGTIRATLTAVPSRVPVLWAKAAVLTALTLPVMVVVVLATFLGGQLLLDAGGSTGASLGDDGVLAAVLGTAGYLTGITLIGLAVGTLLRSTAASISVLVALVFLLPGLGSFLLPAGVRDDVLPYLPSNAASTFTSVVPAPDLLGTGAGVAVFAAWVLVPLLAATVALKRRSV